MTAIEDLGQEEFVKEQVAKVVKSKLDINDFSEGDPLEDLGLTSQTASMIRQDLNAKFRVPCLFLTDWILTKVRLIGRSS